MLTAINNLARQGWKLGLSQYQKTSNCVPYNNSLKDWGVPLILTRLLQTTPSCCDLMEFFEDKENLGMDSVKVGRSWKMEELRIKSNSDLHKLWYILLKERNMLMTMEHECKEALELFPNAERLDKVKESMHNLEEVVIERNRAYHELETGETGVRPSRTVLNQLGLTHLYRMTQHLVPKYVNSKWKETHIFRDNYKETQNFLALLGEKRQSQDTRRKRHLTNHVLGLMRRFPNLDLTAVKEKFPEVDVDKIAKSDGARGHWLP